MNAHNSRKLDGSLARLFQPDELAGYEYRRTEERKTFFDPETRLLYAVLKDAVLCFQRFHNATNKKKKQLFEDAAAWIFESTDNTIFSFEFVCEICGFDPHFLRMGLRKWREQHRLSGPARKTIAQLSRRAARQLKSKATDGEIEHRYLCEAPIIEDLS